MTSCRPGAFTLVEVALALGITGFCLLAVYGMLPVGVTQNMNSLEQTTAGGIATALVADLRAVPGADGDSPFYRIPVHADGPVAQTIFFREDGSVAAVPGSDAAPAQNPRYRATLAFTVPPEGRTKVVRILITWPALADRECARAPVAFTGSFEAVTALDGN